MEEIIKTLSDIDQKSARIMDAASNKKKELELKYSKQKEAYLANADAKASKEIDELRSTLNGEMQQQLNEQSENAQKQLKSLDQSYQSGHTQLAESIFQKLIEV